MMLLLIHAKLAERRGNANSDSAPHSSKMIRKKGGTRTQEQLMQIAKSGSKECYICEECKGAFLTKNKRYHTCNIRAAAARKRASVDRRIKSSVGRDVKSSDRNGLTTSASVGRAVKSSDRNGLTTSVGRRDASGIESSIAYVLKTQSLHTHNHTDDHDEETEESESNSSSEAESESDSSDVDSKVMSSKRRAHSKAPRRRRRSQAELMALVRSGSSECEICPYCCRAFVLHHWRYHACFKRNGTTPYAAGSGGNSKVHSNGDSQKRANAKTHGGNSSSTKSNKTNGKTNGNSSGTQSNKAHSQSELEPKVAATNTANKAQPEVEVNKVNSNKTQTVTAGTSNSDVVLSSSDKSTNLDIVSPIDKLTTQARPTRVSSAGGVNAKQEQKQVDATVPTSSVVDVSSDRAREVLPTSAKTVDSESDGLSKTRGVHKDRKRRRTQQDLMDIYRSGSKECALCPHCSRAYVARVQSDHGCFRRLRKAAKGSDSAESSLVHETKMRTRSSRSSPDGSTSSNLHSSLADDLKTAVFRLSSAENLNIPAETDGKTIVPSQCSLSLYVTLLTVVDGVASHTDEVKHKNVPSEDSHRRVDLNDPVTPAVVGPPEMLLHIPLFKKVGHFDNCSQRSANAFKR